MNQSAEMKLREIIEAYLEENPLRETVFIKILQNKVIIGESIDDLDILVRYPTGESL